jgi:hypothetical protein
MFWTSYLLDSQREVQKYILNYSQLPTKHGSDKLKVINYLFLQKYKISFYNQVRVKFVVGDNIICHAASLICIYPSFKYFPDRCSTSNLPFRFVDYVLPTTPASLQTISLPPPPSTCSLHINLQLAYRCLCYS